MTKEHITRRREPSRIEALALGGSRVYSIGVSEERLLSLSQAGILGWMRAVTTCEKRGKTYSSDPNPHRIPPSEGIEIRNLYVDLRGRRVLKCDGPQPDQSVELTPFDFPSCDSLPPAKPGEPARACQRD